MKLINNEILGNRFDKYGSKNPVVRYLMRNFSLSLFDLVKRSRPETIHDVGCGEGTWTLRLAQQGYRIKGSDLSSVVFEDALKSANELSLKNVIFQEKSIYQLDATSDSADLILCCEVLEHVESPEKALLKLQEVVRGHLLLSVPREPLWRALNFFSGRYVLSLGNTPGHVQHWSKKSFLNLVSNYFEIVESRQPLPWTMVLCRPRKRQ